MEVQFDETSLEEKFKEAENILLNSENITLVEYEDYNHESFDKYNQELFKF